MTLLLTSPNEKTVCADRDDRGGVLLTTETEEQIYLTRDMALAIADLALKPRAGVAICVFSAGPSPPSPSVPDRREGRAMNVALIIFAMLALSVTDKIALKALGQPSSSYVVFAAMFVAYAIGWAVSEFAQKRGE